MSALSYLSPLLLAAVGIPLIYLGALALLARPLRHRATLSKPRYRFAIVVPAHDEELSIAATVRSLLATDYPASARRIIVVAHNCRDSTADVALAAGAEVVVFDDRARATKGDALMRGVGRALADSSIDAVVVVDADTVVSKNLLAAFNTGLSSGAHVLQAEYGVRNIDASWRTRLATLALGMFHRTRNLARERLGLSIGLRGNGMCFARSVLTVHPPLATGLAEDVEYGVQLGLAGYRVAHACDAHVFGEMAVQGRAAATQRRRWEHGRRQLRGRLLPALVFWGVRQRSAMLLDLAMDLLVPPLTYLVLGFAVGAAAETARVVSRGRADALTAVWGVIAFALALYGGRGVQHSGLGTAKAVLALATAPAYVAWKLATMASSPRSPAWVRTSRQAETARLSRARPRPESLPTRPRAP